MSRENSQVLQVAAGEGDVGNNLDLAIAGLGDHDVVTEVTDTALDLDAVVEELLEGGDIKDLVGGGLRSVDNELGIVRCDSLFFSFFFLRDC